MNEQQLINYLYWLKDRGQAYPSLAQTVELTDTPGIAQDTLESLPNSPEAMRLLFISQDTLIDAEQEMVTRIAAALGLNSKDFRTITPNEMPKFVSNFAIALGNLPSDLSLTLRISHPRDMLREPQLKVTAWEKLLTLKSALR